MCGNCSQLSYPLQLGYLWYYKNTEPQSRATNMFQSCTAISLIIDSDCEDSSL